VLQCVCCSVCVAFLSPSTIDQDIEDAFAPKITAGFTKPVCRQSVLISGTGPATVNQSHSSTKKVCFAKQHGAPGSSVWRKPYLL